MEYLARFARAALVGKFVKIIRIQPYLFCESCVIVYGFQKLLQPARRVSCDLLSLGGVPTPRPRIFLLSTGLRMAAVHNRHLIYNHRWR
jgi:hypothetical protein